MLAAAIAVATRLLATGSKADPAAPEAPGRGWTPGLIAAAALAAAGGLALRLVGFGQSLSGDELGTLWAIESSLPDVVSRSASFHGQSPFYYVIAWAFVRMLGESEAVMRLPSLLAIAGAALLIYCTCKTLASGRAGVYGAIAFWWAFLAFRAAGDARPYGVGLFFAALVFYGLAKAVKEGSWSGRAQFVAGAVGLIASHFLLAVLLGGVGIGILLFPALRERYTLGKFALDTAIITAISAPLAPQVFALWGRRGELDWSPAINLTEMRHTFGPELLLAVAALAGVAALSRIQSRAWLGLLGLAVVLPPVTMLAVSYLGTNLLTSRYMAGSLVAACILAGLALDLVPARTSVFGWFGWAALNAMMLGGTFLQAGSFTGAGYQDWRGAVAALDGRLRSEGAVPVLFRSGFVEDDQRTAGRTVSPALLSPLRAPGHSAPTWDLVPLTYNWPLERREEYFERVVAPALEEQGVFYYFSCDCAAGEPSAGYEHRLADWIEKRFPSRYEKQALDAGRGMVAYRFASSASSRGQGLGEAAHLLPEPEGGRAKPE